MGHYDVPASPLQQANLQAWRAEKLAASAVGVLEMDLPAETLVVSPDAPAWQLPAQPTYYGFEPNKAVIEPYKDVRSATILPARPERHKGSSQVQPPTAIAIDNYYAVRSATILPANHSDSWTEKLGRVNRRQLVGLGALALAAVAVVGAYRSLR